MRPRSETRGPFLAAQFRSKDPWELSDGHAIQCFPTGARGGRAETAGSSAISSDPEVEDVGIDTGYSPDEHTLRAPDISAGKIPDQPGWVKGAPRLAVEYADTGQNESDLQVKIKEFFAAGTELIWVVRLTGPRRIEVHQPGKPVRIARPGEELRAPGILKNPLPVEALYDREASNRVTFRNLLERQGYSSLDEVRAEGAREGKREGELEGRLEALREALLTTFEARRLTLDEEARARVAACRDPDLLQRWHRAAIDAASVQEALAD